MAKSVLRKPDFAKIPTEEFRVKSKLQQFENPLVLSKAVERIRRVGRFMLAKEFADAHFMELERQRYFRGLLIEAEVRLAAGLAQGKLTQAEIRSTMAKIRTELAPIDEAIKAKGIRQHTLVDKRGKLLEPRTRELARLALNDSFFDKLFRHDIFSEKVFRRIGDNTHYPVQTIAMIDVDNLKKFNQRFNHIRGGSVLLGAYAAAAEEICKKYGGIVVLGESLGIEGVEKRVSDEEYVKRLSEQGSPITARYGSDEFTFHFNLPADRVYAIMQEFMGIATRNLYMGPLADAIKKSRAQRFFGKAYRGRATGSVVQIDFGFHEQHGHDADTIRKTVMNRVSAAMLDLKDQGKKGQMIEVKDNLTFNQIKRHRGFLGTLKHWFSFS